MKEPIISVSGLRGIIGESLSPELAIRYACAFAAGQAAGPLVVTRDGRTTGVMLAAAIHSALMAAGRDVIDAGIAATPTTGLLVRHHQAAGGIQISASHNPPSYNGMKLFSAEGAVLDAESGRKVMQRYQEADPTWVAFDQIGSQHRCDDTTSVHLEAVLQNVDVERIRARRYRVLLDSNHGAGSLLGQRLLEELGCDVTILGGVPDGRFEHPPEPTAENLADVCSSVTAADAVVGFCQDPDADRLALIDEQGRYVGEEYTLALCLDHVLTKRKGAVVTNCATSRMSEDIAEKQHCSFHRSAVGEANVVALMRQHNAVFGGEGNGGPIDPNVGFVRDSFVGMAMLLDMLAERNEPVSRLAALLPEYAIEKTKITFDTRHFGTAIDELQTRFADAAADRLDGLRLDWDRKWLLVRPSNTEPIVRIIAEAPSRAEAVELCERAARILEETASQLTAPSR